MEFISYFVVTVLLSYFRSICRALCLNRNLVKISHLCRKRLRELRRKDGIFSTQFTIKKQTREKNTPPARPACRSFAIWLLPVAMNALQEEWYARKKMICSTVRTKGDIRHRCDLATRFMSTLQGGLAPSEVTIRFRFAPCRVWSMINFLLRNLFKIKLTQVFDDNLKYESESFSLRSLVALTGRKEERLKTNKSDWASRVSYFTHLCGLPTVDFQPVPVPIASFAHRVPICDVSFLFLSFLNILKV